MQQCCIGFGKRKKWEVEGVESLSNIFYIPPLMKEYIYKCIPFFFFIHFHAKFPSSSVNIKGSQFWNFEGSFFTYSWYRNSLNIVRSVTQFFEVKSIEHPNKQSRLKEKAQPTSRAQSRFFSGAIYYNSTEFFHSSQKSELFVMSCSWRFPFYWS